MEPGEVFGQVLRVRRKAMRLSQEKLALEAGLERVFISLLEHGHRQPTLTTLLKLSGPLQCRAADLVIEVETQLQNPQKKIASDRSPISGSLSKEED